MKKTGIIFLCVLMILQSAAIPAICEGNDSKINQFTDLKCDWSYDSICWCIENDVMNGTSEVTFSPDGTVSRSQFVTALYNLAGKLGYNLNGYVAVDVFGDVKTNKWYSAPIAWGYKNGIVSGYSDGRFGTDDPLSRQDLAVLLSRFIEYYLVYSSLADRAVSVKTYGDSAKIGSYAKQSVANLTGIGMLSGSGGNFMPKGLTTRAEMASVLQRLDAFIAREDVLTSISFLKFGINMDAPDQAMDCSAAKDYLTGEPVDDYTAFCRIKEKGFDHVRLCGTFNYGTYQGDSIEDFESNFEKDPQTGEYHICVNEQNITNALEQCRAANRAGLLPIVDMHSYTSYPNFILHYEEIIADAREVAEEAELPYLDALETAMNEDPEKGCREFFFGSEPGSFKTLSYRASDIFWFCIHSPTCDARLHSEIWAKIAEAFKNEEYPIFFELINERDLTDENVISCLDVIRGTGGANLDRTVVVYTICWEYYHFKEPKGEEREVWDFGKYEKDPNIIFDLHNYRPYSVSENRVPWIPETQDAVKQRVRQKSLDEMEGLMIAADELRRTTGKFVWMGEYGCNTTGGDKMVYAYIREMLAMAAKYHFPACVWDTRAYREDVSYSLQWDQSMTVYFFDYDCWKPDYVNAIFN